MKNLINKLCEDIKININEIKDIRKRVRANVKNIRSMKFDGAKLSNEDAFFLTLLVKKIKPKIIFEVGTWFGGSATVLSEALNNDVIIHTCDVRNLYSLLNNPKDNIYFYNDFSASLIKRGALKDVDFDFVFLDGSINFNEAKWIVKKMRGKLVVCAHDCTPDPWEKGNINISYIKKNCKNLNIPTVAFYPKKEAYKKGHDSVYGRKINSSIGLIMSTEVYKEVFL